MTRLATTAAECALAALLGVLTVWALLWCWEAEEALGAPACMGEPIHGPDVVCVCLTTLSPSAWECWAHRGGRR